MEYFLLVVLCFAVFFGIDKGFQKLFRNRSQHKSGNAVRFHKRYATIGLGLSIIGIVAIVVGVTQSPALWIGGIFVVLCGIGLVIYYLTFGIYYDRDDFLVETFGKKPVAYRYSQIKNQQLYQLQGGATMVELHMNDGTSVQVTSQMPGYDKFLDYAFARWCQQRNKNPKACDFHDPDNSIWFPMVEV